MGQSRSRFLVQEPEKVAQFEKEEDECESALLICKLSRVNLVTSLLKSLQQFKEDDALDSHQDEDQ